MAYRLQILVATEAVGEQGESLRFAVAGEVKPCAKLEAACVRNLEAFERHKFSREGMVIGRGQDGERREAGQWEEILPEGGYSGYIQEAVLSECSE